MPASGEPDLEALGVGLSAFQSRLLAVALQLEDLQVRGRGGFVRAAGLVEALDVAGRDLEFVFGLETVDFAEQRAFAKLQPGLGEIGLGLLEIGGALFPIATLLRLELLDPVPVILVAGLGVPRAVERAGAVELGDDIAFAHTGAAGSDLGEHEIADVAELRHRDGDGFDRLYGTRSADPPPDLAPFHFGEGGRAGPGGRGRGGSLPVAGRPGERRQEDNSLPQTGWAGLCS